MRQHIIRKLAMFVLPLFLAVTRLSAQNAAFRENYTKVYYSPVILGLDIQTISPVTALGTDYGGSFSILDISLLSHFPLDSQPTIQPLARLGIVVTQATYSTEINQTRFDNTSFYATTGLAYGRKLSKQFEVGFGAEAGFGYSLFPNLDQNNDSNTYGAFDFKVALGANVIFNPSYNLALDFHPSIRYGYSFSPLERFNGFSFALGVRVGYRFGKDPDAAGVELRSIEFKNPHMENMFSAMQSYYTTHPVGEITLSNTEDHALTNLNVEFFQPGYMSTPTPVATLPQLLPGESTTLPITAVFNQNISNIVGVTPLTGEISVAYTMRTRNSKQRLPVSYDLYDKNSITWDDDRKVAAFITPGDSALSNYVSFLRQATKDVVNSGYSEALQTAMQVYYGLQEIGTLYQRDPISAFDDVQGNPLLIDTVNLPRETLVKLAGDCDDLTVLYNAILESTGIETGFITTPGHLFPIFSTGIPDSDYALIHPDKNMTLSINGVLWVPVEITFIGDSDFLGAWRAGFEEFNRYVDDKNQRKLYLTREAQNIYRAINFEEKDLGLQYGERSKILQDFDQTLQSSIRLVLDDQERRAQAANNKSGWNKMGITAAQVSDYAVAERAFNNALALDRNYTPSKINLANVYYEREEFPTALRFYHDAEESLRENGQTSSSSYSRLILNIAVTYYDAENFDQSTRYLSILNEINPRLAERYSYLSREFGLQQTDFSTSKKNLFIEE